MQVFSIYLVCAPWGVKRTVKWTLLSLYIIQSKVNPQKYAFKNVLVSHMFSFSLMWN